MPQSNQEYTARRFQSLDNENVDGYECELPNDVRTELLPPKRPRILRRPAPRLQGRSGFLKWVGAFGLAAVILAGVIANYSQRQPSATPAVKAMPTQQPVPTPAATPVPLPSGSAERWKAYLATQQTKAPRAILVKLPPPRAQLVSLPEWSIGEARPVMMPYNLEVLRTG